MCLAITIKCNVKVVDSWIRIGDPVASECKLGTPGFHSRSEEINWPIFIVQIASFILLVLSRFWQMTGLLLPRREEHLFACCYEAWVSPHCCRCAVQPLHRRWTVQNVVYKLNVLGRGGSSNSQGEPVEILWWHIVVVRSLIISHVFFLQIWLSMRRFIKLLWKDDTLVQDAALFSAESRIILISMITAINSFVVRWNNCGCEISVQVNTVDICCQKGLKFFTNIWTVTLV